MISVWRLLVAFFVVSVSGFTNKSEAKSPNGWDRTIILRGQERAVVKSMPIEKRPNRPLHVYGNTVRRLDNRSRK